MKKRITLFTILVLLTTNFPNNTSFKALAAELPYGITPVSIQKAEIRTDRNQALRFFGENDPCQQHFTEPTKKKVTLIVELKQPPLLDVYNQTTVGIPLDDLQNERNSYALFRHTKRAATMEDKVLLQQEKTIHEISDTLYHGNDITVVDQFTNVVNAFVMESSPADMKAIEKLPAVKNVYISKIHERIKPVTDLKNTGLAGTGSSLMNADQVPYHGEGMVIAILDTGIDTSHEAFANAPKNQKYTKSDMEKMISVSKLASKTGKIPITCADDVYVNDKIPYAYDYFYKDNNVNSSIEAIKLGNDHGTHVAGIAAGNSNTLKGIAPQAQLMIMKIFPDDGGSTYDYIYFKALEDCVTLGVDVINMSVGAACGYTDDNSTIDNEILNRIIKSGINLAASASNYASSAAYNSYGYHRALTSNPDTSTVGSPSTNTAALSVASVENAVMYTPCICLADGAKIGINDTSENDQDAFIRLISNHQQYEYIYVNSGLPSDYVGLDLKGKIAVANRGLSTFSQKTQEAHTHGAVGLIVINNQPGIVNMHIDNYYIPAASITSTDGARLLAQKDHILTVMDYELVPKETAGKISEFSSWGVTPDLLLKPEISAIGGSVLSAVPFNQYANMGGTSMASPQIAGISALLKEYIRKDSKFFRLTKKDVEPIVSGLLMSTATPVKTAGRTVTGAAITVACSPRRQGAGLVNAYAALNTKALLYTTGKSKRPVLNLGDNVSENGIYTKSFHVQNYSEETLTYLLDSTVMTESCEIHESKSFIAETPTLLESKAGFCITGSSSTSTLVNTVSGSALTLAPYEDVEIMVTIDLTQTDKDYIKNIFENGEFVEGFITLTSIDSDSIDLNLPFAGFFGDWTKAPILDYATCYDDPLREGYQPASNTPFKDTASMDYHNNLSQLRGIWDTSGSSIMLGQNPYDFVPVHDPNKIAISPNNDGILDGKIWWIYSALRGSKTTEYELTNSSGTQLSYQRINGDRKAFYDSSSGLFTKNSVLLNWTGRDSRNRPLPNNAVVTFIFKASLDFTSHEPHNLHDTVLLPITIDLEAPDFIGMVMSEDEKKLYVSVSDNQYIAAAILYAYENNKISNIIDGHTLNEAKKHTVSLVGFALGENPQKQYMLSLIDYAGNESSYIISFRQKELIKNR